MAEAIRSARFFHEVLDFDDDASDPAGADETALVLGRDAEAQTAALDLVEVRFCPDLSADGGGAELVDLNGQSDGGEAVVKTRFRCWRL